VFSRCGTFSGTEAQFRSWVFTIAHHRLVDDRRAAGRRPRSEPLDEAPAGASPVSAAAEDVAMQRFGEERVAELLDTLTDDQRAVLTLRVIADMTIDDVASALGKPPGAVKALQRRGLESLRRTLASKGVAR
jgi:RNA polymerase sigma-70 factor (ECF subfamily)